MNPEYYKICWHAVTKKVNQYSDKPYSSGYVRNVAHNYQTNHQLTNLLKKLGIIQGEIQ